RRAAAAGAATPATIEVEQRVRSRIVRESPVQREQPLSGGAETEALAVEREERYLLRGVEPAQRDGEFEAIDDLRDLRDEDMLGAKIPVRVDDSALERAALEQRPVPLDELELERLYAPHRVGRQLVVRAAGRKGIARARRYAPLHRIDVARAVPRRTGRARVELDQLPRDALEIGVEVRPPADVGERRAVRQTPHLDEPVHGLAVRVVSERKACPGANERDDAQIRVFREPPVQRDLELAVGVPRFPIAEVDQAEADRLFELVDEARRKEDPREMGLDGFDVIGPVGKRAAALEKRGFLRERDFLRHARMLGRAARRRPFGIPRTRSPPAYAAYWSAPKEARERGRPPAIRGAEDVG